jgi:hypothetical protein
MCAMSYKEYVLLSLTQALPPWRTLVVDKVHVPTKHACGSHTVYGINACYSRVAKKSVLIKTVATI